MSIGRAFYCDGPDCEAHTSPIARPAPYLPYGFMEVRQSNPDESWQFCGWDCLMKYAATQPIPERIRWDEPPGAGS